jgi:hypothetical protein|tara:strand:- start:1337 stop:2449 length:1113 start_codon:yes stop_codon:yes gene_type:complete
VVENALEIRTVRIRDARVEMLRAMRRKRPVFVWGGPGIGKSDLVDQITVSMEGYMIDLRLALMEPTDLRGMPYYNKEANNMSWAAPVDLPTEELAAQYPVVVLFLDELNSAPPSVQAAAYQLILNRRIGTYKLPDNVVVVAAGNRETDKGVTYKMPKPLANRFVHLNLDVNFDDWMMWAAEARVHADVVGYLSFAKADLYNFDPRSPDHAFASPRTWVFVSEMLEDTAGDDPMSDSQMTDLIAGTVGEGMAVKFMNHRSFASELPNPSDILSGKVEELKVKEVSAQYTLTVNLCYELADAHKIMKKSKKLDKWHKMADNFFSFMMENFQTEMVVLGAKIALSTYNLPFDTKKLKTFKEFYNRYGQMIIDA